MKIFVLLLVLASASLVSAQRSSLANGTSSAFAARVAKAFESKTLGSLDGGPKSSIKVTIEHSLGEEPDKIKSRTFHNLKSAQSWIRSQTGRETRFESGRLRRCGASKCDFAQNGMLHNHLYLVNFTYGTVRGKYHLKTLSVLDGD
jgi:hypothetical protein